MIFKSKWVISRNLDLLIFLLAPIFLLLVALFFNPFGGENLYKKYFYWILIDRPHVIFTYFVILLGVGRGKLTQRSLVLSFLLLSSLTFAFYFVDSSRTFFFYFVLYSLFFHHIKQFIGYLKLSTPGSDSLTVKKIDEFFLYIVMLFPFIWLHSDRSLLFEYLNRIPIPHFFSAESTDLFHLLFWLAVTFYFIFQGWLFYSRKVHSLSKYLIIFSAFLCYYVSIVMFHNIFYFIYAIAGIHCLSYCVFSFQFLKRKTKESVPAIVSWFNPNRLFGLVTLFTLIYTFAILQVSFFPAQSNFPGTTSYWVPFFWSFEIFHFYIDRFIWRRPIME